MEENQVIALIESAFSDVSRPENELITGCSCWECQEIRDDFSAHDPADIDPDRMRYHSWDMTFLTPEARHYFLPKWMILGIRLPEMAYAEAAIETLGYEEGWNVPDGYSADQRQSILAFLVLIREHYGDRYEKDLHVAWAKWAESDVEHEDEESRSSNGG